MAHRHIVRPGDCVSSIAVDNGFWPETLWEHAENAELRRRREDMNALMPGDVVFVPDLRVREFGGETDRRHRFRRKGVPERLKVRFLRDGQPRANEDFELEIDGATLRGRTDAQGRIDVPIAPNARGACVTLLSTHETFALRLGELKPADEVSGAQARLRNLGYYHGPVDGSLDARTTAAVLEFQVAYGLERTGELDAATKRAIASAYDRGEP